MRLIGHDPGTDYQLFFDIAVEARNRAKALMVEKFANSDPLYGWQVDDAARACIKEKGFAEYFTRKLVTPFIPQFTGMERTSTIWKPRTRDSLYLLHAFR